MKAHNQIGFTLIELMVAVVLTGFLTLLVYGGLRLGYRSWEAISERQAQIGEVYQTQSALRRLLGRVPLRHLRDQNNQLQAPLYGAASRMIFLTPLPNASGGESLFWVSLGESLSETGEVQLVMYSQAFNDAEPLDWALLQQTLLTESEPKILVSRGVSRVSFEYLEDSEDKVPEWQPEWSEQTHLPALIRLQLETDASLLWPELFVAPQVYAYEIKRTF